MGMARLILTGGIGSGKSAAAQILADLGAVVIEADRIGHEVLAAGGEAYEAVARRWPQVVRNGEIDRRGLGRIVFADHGQLAELEAITHPAIAQRIGRLVEAAGDRLVVVELPVTLGLPGSDWLRVVVDAPDELRRTRLRQRGLDDDEIDRRMSAQPSRAEWLSVADRVLDNSGDLDDLRSQVEKLFDAVRSEQT